MKIESIKQLDAELNEKGYKFIGWQNSWDHGTDHPEYRSCMQQKHKINEVRHDNKGYENTCSCDICKIYWKFDSSD